MPPSEQRRSTSTSRASPSRCASSRSWPTCASALRETTEAARRLAEEARADRARVGPAPAARLGPPRSEERRRRTSPTSCCCSEQTGALLSEVVRGLVPAELRQQFTDAFRELLVAVRALIDWYLERLGRRARGVGRGRGHPDRLS